MNRKVGASGNRGEGSVLGRRCWVLLIFCLLLFLLLFLFWRPLILKTSQPYSWKPKSCLCRRPSIPAPRPPNQRCRESREKGPPPLLLTLLLKHLVVFGGLHVSASASSLVWGGGAGMAALITSELGGGGAGDCLFSAKP